jgi:hypothetical protein
MNFVIPFLIGIFFSKIRPNIDISEKVSCYRDDEGKKVFAIKILNRSRRPVINFKAELGLVSQRIVKGGPVQRWKEITFVRSNPMQIEKYNKKDPEIERLQKEKERLERTLLDLTCEVQLLKKRVD